MLYVAIVVIFGNCINMSASLSKPAGDSYVANSSKDFKYVSVVIYIASPQLSIYSYMGRPYAYGPIYAYGAEHTYVYYIRRIVLMNYHLKTWCCKNIV